MTSPFEIPALGFQGPAGYQGQQGPYAGQSATVAAVEGEFEEGVIFIQSEEEKDGLYKLIRCDYNQEFVDFGEPPQNFLREVDASVRFANYPRWSRLISAAEAVHRARVHPPQQIKADLRQVDLRDLTMGGQVLFDVILIDPPWQEYVDRSPGVVASPENCWSLEDLKTLPIPEIAETPSFIFIWAGDTHLDDARQLLLHWGYRRCEDITWLKTMPHMTQRPGAGIESVLAGHVQGEVGSRLDTLDKLRRVIDLTRQEEYEDPVILGYNDDECVLKRVKEHCLMGVRGAVRRSQDHHIVHANIDTDVIVGDAPLGLDPDGLANTRKPAELYEIIERFALARRKLELFATERSIRPGWLTVGREISKNEYDGLSYASWFEDINEGQQGHWEPGQPCPETLQYLQQNATNGSTFNALTQGQNLDSGSVREEFPLTNPNAYPFIKDFRGGRYEGSTPLLETLRPKSPPQRPTVRAWEPPMA